MVGAAFVDSLIKTAESQGRSPSDLFITLAGMIYGLSSEIGAECLTALDAMLEGGASAKNCSLGP